MGNLRESFLCQMNYYNGVFFFNYEIYRFLKTSPAIGGFFHARAKFELLKKKEKSAMLEIVSGLTQLYNYH